MKRSNLDTLRIIVPGTREALADQVPGDNFHALAPEEMQANRETLVRKAKRKDLTRAVNRHLVRLTHSALHMYYQRCGRCGRVMKQEGNKITTWYCQTRHCLNCCAIRTAKLINAYLPTLHSFDDPVMLTLTIRDGHVTDNNLRETCETMIANWRKVYLSVRKKWKEKEAIDVEGFRGFECTGSWDKKRKRHKYHPHFHVIVNGHGIAKDMQRKWLELNPDATEINQRIVPADVGSMKEILKYFTKYVDKKFRTVTTRHGKRKKVCYAREINVHRLDVMLQSLDGLRLFNAFGIKKIADDEKEMFEDLEAQEYKDLECEVTKWFWQDGANDWVDITTGELLSGNMRTPHEQSLIDAIRPCGDRKFKIERDKKRKVDRVKNILNLNHKYGLLHASN